MTAATEAELARPAAATRRRRAGRAPIVVSVALAVLGALAVLVWALVEDEGDALPAAGPRAPAEAPEPPAPEGPALRLELGRVEEPQAPREAIPLAQRPRTDPRTRFAGTGVLEGRVRVPQGAVAPRAWSLVMVPSAVLIGGEHASARREEFTDGELEFTLRDVPLGGYEVWAEAEGMVGRHEHLLLAHPDATLVYQVLSLVPMAYVEGRVLDEQGVGVAGLPMHLVPQAGGARLETRADATGHYLFERVPDGEYLLQAGFADAPLAPPLELAVVAPSLHVPTVELPRLFELVARVLDADGLALEGAIVRGWCSNGGRVEAVADASGLARQPWLPAGRLTLDVARPGRPEAGALRTYLDFPPADGAQIELRLRR